ncbi:MAG: CBS domain-containing protein [Candidatus Gygaella obscura]|nr:CBS domain-containing protein [Candidatus Gygaella obscura]
MKAKEIMSKNVITVSPNDDAQEALGLLQRKRISALPVVDDKGEAIGMFSEKEILSFVFPSYIQHVGKFVYEENPKSIKKKFNELKGVPVRKLMREGVLTINENVTLCEIARIMMTEKSRRICVIDDSKKLLGIVGRCDAIAALIKEAEEGKE